MALGFLKYHNAGSSVIKQYMCLWKKTRVLQKQGQAMQKPMQFCNLCINKIGNSSDKNNNIAEDLPNISYLILSPRIYALSFEM